MNLVKAQTGMTCEKRQKSIECGELASVCDLDAPTDVTQGPRFYCTEHSPTHFDYERQAWVVDGCYVRCGHPEGMETCICFGRLHEGEPEIILER